MSTVSTIAALVTALSVGGGECRVSDDVCLEMGVPESDLGRYQWGRWWVELRCLDRVHTDDYAAGKKFAAVMKALEEESWGLEPRSGGSVQIGGGASFVGGGGGGLGGGGLAFASASAFAKSGGGSVVVEKGDKIVRVGVIPLPAGGLLLLTGLGGLVLMGRWVRR